jgi:hypothetical protein
VARFEAQEIRAKAGLLVHGSESDPNFVPISSNLSNGGATIRHTFGREH